MKTTSIEKTINLADGLEVILTMDGEGRVESVAAGDAESVDAVLVLRLADLIGREDKRTRSVCADHGEYKPEKGSYRCSRCKADEEAARAAELAQAAA